MTIKKFEFNMLPVNTYVVWDETKEAVVIDAGCFFDSEKQKGKSAFWTSLWLLLL